MSQLRELRKRKKLTLTDVRLMTGVDTGGLSRIERGESYPKIKTAKRLSDFYNISLGAVFNAVPPRSKPTTRSKQYTGVSHTKNGSRDLNPAD